MLDAAPAERTIRCCSRCKAIYRKDLAYCPSDGGEIEVTAEDPLIGTELEHYVIDALIGEGAMGRVYRGHHKTLVHKTYALKILLGDLASTQEMRMRFVNEAKSASRLSHGNVVSVVDFGRTSKGLLYLVMELVDGIPISALIDRGPIEPIRAASLASGVALGLHHAHELGLVHRDLKPENVIVISSPAGEIPRVVDFGIAISSERSDLRLTTSGMAMGTPAYIAPEQVSGNEMDARADQYALGVSLFEMLTGGGLPFSGDPTEVVTRKVTDDPPLLADRMPEGVTAPPGLARIVDKMISRKPGRRFPDMASVAAALDRWIESGGIDTDLVIKQPPRRGRSRWLAASGIGVLAASAALAWTLIHTRAPGAPAATASAEHPPVITPPAAVTPPQDDPPTPEIVDPESPTASPQPGALALLWPVPLTADDSEDIVDPPPSNVAPPKNPGRPPRHPAGRKPHRTKPKVIATATVPHETTPPPVIPAPIPPVPPTPPPAPEPRALQARVRGVDVQGSLSQAVIERAVDRVRPAVERCTATGTPHTVKVQFTIDESRRAHGVHGSGGAVDCVVAAIAGVRTEAAPDTGDVEVVVKIEFRASS